MDDRTFPPSAYCPYFQRTLEMVGRRWTGAVLRSMFAGNERFSDIAASIPGISARLLAERLRELVDAGVVAPPGKNGGAYRLTRSGEDLREALSALERWSRDWAVPTGLREKEQPEAPRGLRPR
jgi:DNA-binding HxlR family transcriptional regulator